MRCSNASSVIVAYGSSHYFHLWVLHVCSICWYEVHITVAIWRKLFLYFYPFYRMQYFMQFLLMIPKIFATQDWFYRRKFSHFYIIVDCKRIIFEENIKVQLPYSDYRYYWIGIMGFMEMNATIYCCENNTIIVLS